MTCCPACEGENPPQARFCLACGTPLVMRCPACDTINARTRTSCHHCHAALGVPVADEAVASVSVSGPDLDLPATDWQSFRIGLPEPDPPPSPTVPLELPGSAPTPAAHPESTPEKRRHDRAERRAAVRRSQLRRHSVPDAPTLRDVLVLEPDTDTRIDLCALLETFGFRPHVAVTVAEAEGLSLRQPHIAAFLGAGEDIDATAAFCRRLHDTTRSRPSALIAVGDRGQHADRVQWQLAGADQLIFRPVTRGDLARALTDTGLGLPDDPRHGARPRS